MKILLWGSILFFLFIAITKTRIYKLFYSDKEIESPPFSFLNIEEETTDFDEAIRLQMAEKQYRMAIRLLYLKVIDHLRNQEYIDYSKEKTNVDYLGDLTNSDIKSQFYTVTSIYNHVWYGDIEIAEDQFLKFESSFQILYATIDAQ